MEEPIIELWNGRIAPCQYCGAQDARSISLHAAMGVCGEKLRKTLLPEQAELLERYISLSESFLIRSMELAFRDGFRCGSRIVMDALK